MLKREIKINFKSFLIWTLIVILLLVMVFSVYPSLSKDQEAFNEMMKVFPKEMLEIFNMDIINMGSALGWILSEGFMMISILSGAYFSILGSSILLKEEDEGTIDFLASKPISRNKIIITKIITGFFYILVFNTIISFTNLIGLNLNNDFDFVKWSLMTFSIFILNLFFFTLTLLISIFYKKTRKSMVICLGIMFGTYILSVLGNMSNKVEFLKYLSPFYYISSRTIITDNNLNIFNVVLLFIFTITFTVISINLYRKKELSL